MRQIEITEAIPLLDARGNLTQAGYAKRLLPVYQRARDIVFSEPQVDVVYDEDFPMPRMAGAFFAVEALPGQFDQRADSAAQCIQLMAGGERPLVA